MIVQPLDQVVPLLIQLVDRPLHLGQIGSLAHGAAGDVLLVPEAEVLLMLKTNDAEKPLVGVVDLLSVPSGYSRLMEVDNCTDINHGPCPLQDGLGRNPIRRYDGWPPRD